MKLLFEKISLTYVYNLDIESIVYNRDKLPEDVVEAVGENFGQELCDLFRENSKYIRDQLDITDFEVTVSNLAIPTIQLKFSCDMLLDENSLKSILGRYTTKEYRETFDNEQGTSEIVFKPIRGELKIYLSR